MTGFAKAPVAPPAYLPADHGTEAPAPIGHNNPPVDPHGLLANVHPDLVRVILAASQVPQPFAIDYGIRTLAEEEEAVRTGHSETLHSRHLPDPHYPDAANPDGLAMAVDFYCIVGGKISWLVANSAGGTYGIAAAQILAAGARLGVKLQWGGLKVGAWVDGVPSNFRDWGHIQLDPSAYP